MANKVSKVPVGLVADVEKWRELRREYAQLMEKETLLKEAQRRIDYEIEKAQDSIIASAMMHGCESFKIDSTVYSIESPARRIRIVENVVE